MENGCILPYSCFCPSLQRMYKGLSVIVSECLCMIGYRGILGRGCEQYNGVDTAWMLQRHTAQESPPATPLWPTPLMFGNFCRYSMCIGHSLPYVPVSRC